MGAVTEKDLEAATYEIEKEAPEWLRALLEENKKLQQKLKDYEGCKGVEDYYRVLSELRQTKEELSHVSTSLSLSRVDANRLREDLEQFKAELQRYEERRQTAALEVGKLVIEHDRVKSELSDKNKVLEWIRDNTQPSHWQLREIHNRARSILSQYPPRREEDET